jgi:hypothetical protein
LPTRTSGVLRVERLKPFRSSTGRTLEQRADGRGIAIASNAAGRRAATMAQTPKSLGTRASGTGARETPPPQQGSISGAPSNKNTDLPRMTWMRCGKPKMGAALSASDRPRASSSTTVIPEGMFAPCSVRHATRSWVGMRRRRTRSSSSRNISRITLANDGHCHADVLLELANPETALADPARGVA